MKVVNDKTKTKVEQKLKEIGAHDTSIWLIDMFIRKYVGLNASDLPDTSTYANGIDSVEECLEDSDIVGAIDIAQDTAIYMLEDEGMDIEL